MSSFDRWSLILIGVAILAVFAGAIRNDFMLDAEAIVRDNPRVMESRFGEIWRTDWWNRPMAEDPKTLYRPVTMTWMALVALFGTSAKAFNIGNLLLHLLVAVARYGLVRRLLRDHKRASLMAALVLAGSMFHAMATEAVVGMVGAAEILMALFTTLGWWSFDLAISESRRSRALLLHALAGIALLSAMLSKENAALMGLVFAAHYVIARRPRTAGDFAGMAAALLPAAVATGAWVLVRVAVLGRFVTFGGTSVYDGFTTLERLATALNAFGTAYLPRLLWPFDLMPNLTHADIAPTGSVFHPGALLGLLMVLGLSGGAAVLLWRRSLAALGLLYAFVVLLPTSNLLISIGAVGAYRFFYAAVFGLAFAAVLGIHALLDRRVVVGRIALGLYLLVAVLGVAGSLGVIELWRRGPEFAAACLRLSPRSAWALQNDTWVNALAREPAASDTERLRALNRLDDLRPHLPRIPSSGKVDMQSSISFYRLLMNRASFKGTIATKMADIEAALADCREAETYAVGQGTFLLEARVAAARMAVNQYELAARESLAKEERLHLTDMALSFLDSAAELVTRETPNDTRALLDVLRFRALTYRAELDPSLASLESPDTWLQSALAIDPDHVDARIIAADQARRAGRIAEVLEHIQVLRAAGRTTVTACRMAINAAQALNRPREVLEWQELALTLKALSPADADFQQRLRAQLMAPGR